ncbi:MAG: Tol-Pal system beta propeller repeat protein TolB [Endomicrobiia bacterium]|nr:MAG: Tol-Pal system beta propeller repeat protein TolB [Endomicrobiia bacterium]
MNLNVKINLIKKIHFLILYVIFIIFFSTMILYANNDIHLSLCATTKKSDIAIEHFKVADKNENTIKLAKLIKRTIKNDLILSRYFNIIQTVPENNFKEQLSSLRKKGITVFITASVNDDGCNIVFEIKVIDVVTGEMIWKHNYKHKRSNYRYLAHEASDEIIRRIKGEIGIARSKIVFVNDSTRFKELYIVDYDGYNLRRLTKDNKINILPKWSPDGEQIIYTSYLYNNPDLFVLNLIENKRSIISKYQGLNVTGSFSPDGKKIILTLSKGRYPNLYMINIRGELLQRMTENVCIDTSPSFAPNGQEIVFISDRPGYPQLYIMNISGGNVRRLTTNGPCDSPSWSPRGDKIAFTMKQAKGNYDLYLYDLPTTKVTRLTYNQKNNENPTWSPDGRFLAFYSNRSGRGEIYIIAIDGSFTRKLVEIPGTSYTPSWSPILG